MKHTTTPTAASLEALHALSNRIVPVRWQLAGLLRYTNCDDVPANVLKHIAAAQAALKAAVDELVDEYHKEARNDE